MLNDEILERIFANKEMQKIPIGTQATAVSVFEHVLEEIKEEKPYVNVSDKWENLAYKAYTKQQPYANAQ